MKPLTEAQFEALEFISKAGGSIPARGAIMQAVVMALVRRDLLVRDGDRYFISDAGRAVLRPCDGI